MCSSVGLTNGRTFSGCSYLITIQFKPGFHGAKALPLVSVQGLGHGHWNLFKCQVGPESVFLEGALHYFRAALRQPPPKKI
jgi:hypothetical protein